MILTTPPAALPAPAFLSEVLLHSRGRGHKLLGSSQDSLSLGLQIRGWEITTNNLCQEWDPMECPDSDPQSEIHCTSLPRGLLCAFLHNQKQTLPLLHNRYCFSPIHSIFSSFNDWFLNHEESGPVIENTVVMKQSKLRGFVTVKDHANRGD